MLVTMENPGPLPSWSQIRQIRAGHQFSGQAVRGIIVGMPHNLNAPSLVKMHQSQSRNVPTAKSKCSNSTVAVYHFWSECPSDFTIVKTC